MPGNRTLTFVLMDAPFESARTTTAMRLQDDATADRWCSVANPMAGMG